MLSSMGGHACFGRLGQFIACEIVVEKLIESNVTLLCNSSPVDQENVAGKLRAEKLQ